MVLKKQLDIRMAKSKLIVYGVKYSINGQSSKSGSVAACKHMEAGNQMLDESVYKWYVQQKACSTKVTARIIHDACEQLNKHLGIQCRANDSQLWHFLNKHGPHGTQMRGEAGREYTADTEICWVKLNELIKKGLLMSQVYNC